LRRNPVGFHGGEGKMGDGDDRSDALQIRHVHVGRPSNTQSDLAVVVKGNRDPMTNN